MGVQMNAAQIKTAHTVPVHHGDRVVYLDGRVPVSQLKAALGCSGLVVKADRDGLRITLPERIVL